MIVKSLVHGAVSLVNAIATGNGAAVGIDTFVKTTLEVKEGTGIYITSDNKTISSRLINKVIQNSVPKKQLEKTRLELDFQSNIPTGYGLKSSSAISTAVSMVCSKAFQRKFTDKKILKISSFGTLKLRYKKERIGRNPKTGVEHTISARNTISFIASKILKNKVNSK